MADKLRIYACSGVGDNGKIADYYPFWTDGTNPADNTQAVNSLLVRLNSLNIDIEYLDGLTEEEKIVRMNLIDLYSVCLEAAKKYKNNTELLSKAGYAIGQVIKAGRLNTKSTDKEYRSAKVEMLTNEIFSICDSSEEVKDKNAEFTAWWNENVIQYNHVGLTKEQRKSVKKAEKEITISGIGGDSSWENDKNISNYLLNAAVYFTYFYFSKEQLRKLPRIFTTKHNIQKKLYNQCAAYFVPTYGSIDDMDEIIRSGLKQKYHHTAEEVCAKIVSGDIKPVNGGPEPISWTIEAIVAIIVAVVGALGSIITAIIQAIRDTQVAKYQAVTREEANKGCPDPEDYDDYDLDKGWMNVKSNWLPLAAIGVAAVLLLKR